MCLLLSGGIIAIFGGSALGYSGAGPFGCVILAFIANVSWRRQSGWGNPQQLVYFKQTCSQFKLD